MRRPGLVWGAIVGGIATGVTALDVWCERRKDESTLSCVTRRAVAAIPGGRIILAAGLAASAVGFFEHIDRPLRAAASAAATAAATIKEAHG